MLGEWIRRNGFWVLDLAKGSAVRKHFLDIRYIMDNNSAPQARARQDRYLADILTYASRNVPFYRQFGGKGLKDFPVVDKNTVKECYEDFQSREFRDQRVHELHTSGSTGTPFVVRQDLNKRHRVYAEMIYFWGKAGFQIGQKYVFFRIWTDINRKTRFTAWARNLVMHDILRLDHDALEAVSLMLKSDKKIKMLLSYASTFDNLASYLYEQGAKPNMFSVNTIISSSEVLQESTREKLKSVFGCNVVSLYSNQENGMLAQECVENKEFHLNTASYAFEFLKLDCDEPAELNEPARIVVTDLFNHAMPLIRYDTGDIALLTDKCECGWQTKAIKKVLGRAMDCIYDTQGRMISPVTVTNYMWPFDKLLQFQFVQENVREYTLKLNGARGVYDDSVFIEMFKRLLGEDAQVKIEHVNEIPVLSSGKRKHVVSELHGRAIGDASGVS